MLKAAVRVGLLLLFGLSGANAADLELTDPFRWVVVASRSDQVNAIDLARDYARDVDGIRVVRSINGLHAIIFGPVSAKTPAEVQARLAGRFSLPRDAFLAKGGRFVELKYTAPPSPILAFAEYDGTKPTTIKFGIFSITLDGIHDADKMVTSTLHVRGNGTDIPPITRRGTNSFVTISRVRVVHLDPRYQAPQIVFAYYTGGAHCCTATQILILRDDHTWRVIDGETLDAYGYEFEDVDGDGAVELISNDNSFLYKFDAYSGSVAPPRADRLVGDALINVTSEPAMRPLVQRGLRQMEFSTPKNPTPWSSNGYLGGWVATKALLGEIEDAWRRMLVTYDRDPSTYEQECLIGLKIEQCPADKLRRLPFPESLRNLLLAKGYPVPVGFTSAPVIAKGPPVLPSPPAVREPPQPSLMSTSGSSFFITAEGHLLTNAHVVSGCRTMTVSYGAGEVRTGRTIARDETNDLAILKVDTSPSAIASFRSGVRLGESIAVYGFPLSGLLASGGNFTLGNVTALSGLRDDSRILQISAPVQPGNSGGPLLDETGAVVGIVVSKLNALRLALATSDLAQNINFAIKATTALAFAETQGLKIRTAVTGGPALRPADLADLAKSMAALVECQR